LRSTTVCNITLLAKAASKVNYFLYKSIVTVGNSHD